MRLSNCPRGLATQCTHSDDAGVTCQNSRHPTFLGACVVEQGSSDIATAVVG